jgi:hypothetical protein
VPFHVVSAVDRFCRFMLRSRVDVRFNASGADTIASFAFYGPSAWALHSRYAKVFAKPALPPELTAYSPRQQVPGAPEPAGDAPEPAGDTA